MAEQPDNEQLAPHSEGTTPPESPKLGTFIGVFTPTVLTILGLMLYLRIGWVVGNAGLMGALAIVIIANLITLATALSMSTLATNMNVGVGGAYYLISRTLGLEFGGAVGIPLYLSQTVSITLYAYGLAESIYFITGVDAGPWEGTIIQVVALATIALVTLVAAKSTELTLKAQLPVMGLIVLSLIALFSGVEWQSVQADMWGSYKSESAPGFWSVFAVFFPAVTGVLAGVSLSGDLKSPRKAIPLGALAAVAVGFVVYLVVPVALAYSASSDALMNRPLIWMEIAPLGPLLIVGGLWGAVLSSAFGSILGAPRTLQALAFDGLVPSWVGRNDPKSGEPVLGLRLSGLIAFVAAIFLPDLDTVATWVTIFFLTTYGALNLVACLEAIVGDSGFRPSLRVPWLVSLFGAIGCFVAMFLIDWTACVVALVVEGVLLYVLSRRSMQTAWGDVRTGIWISAARFALLQLRESRVDPRNWRPLILVFTNQVERHLPMIQLADAMGQRRGIVTVVELIVGQGHVPERSRRINRENQMLVDQANLTAFCEVTSVRDLHAGMLGVTQANGFAGLQSNTVMMGLPADDLPLLARILETVRALDSLEKSVLLRYDSGRGEPPADAPIIVWWTGREHNGDLMLLLAHLLRSASLFRASSIALKSIVSSESEAQTRQMEFAELLPDIRIEAAVEVIIAEQSQSIPALIRKHSRGAGLVMLGLAIPEEGQEAEVASRVAELTQEMPDCLFVRNAGPFRGKLV